MEIGIDEFPGPNELWYRWSLNIGIEEISDENVTEPTAKKLRPKYDAELANINTHHRNQWQTKGVKSAQQP